MSGVVYPRGKVYLLGAGIGQSSFLTLQARAILATAEVLWQTGGTTWGRATSD